MATEVARLCAARNRRGEPCRKPPIPGGSVCASHGGGAPAVRAAAARRLAIEEAQAHVEASVAVRGTLTLREVYRELLTTATMAVQWRDELQKRVDELTRWRYSAAGSGAEQLRSEVTLYERALDRTVKTLELIARLDLDSRATALDQRAGELVGLAVERALAAGDLTVDQSAAVRTQLAVEFRKLAQEDL